MKPVKTFEGSVESNLDGYSIEMDLDLSPEGRAHLLSLMTDLYSDPAMAVLREYSTNALDAHIEAGTTRPIEVTLPSALNPYLVIKDYGLGLSVNDLETVYSKYGASTKRGSNAVNGMLGLGGKSALTLTSQFTVTSVKGGVKYQIVVTRNEDGIGVMEVVDTSGTTEPNGVEIRVPSSAHDFEAKAAHLFYFWKPGTVLVNGKRPVNIFEADDVAKIGDNVYVKSYRGRHWNDSARDIIVMGNVPYEMRDNALTQMTADGNSYKQTVAFVEMGDVLFAPSREALSYTPRTIATIERIRKEIQANIVSSVEAEFQTASSYADAFSIWRKWIDVVGEKAIPDIEYNGHKFIASVKHHGFIFVPNGGRYNYRSSVHRDKCTEYGHVLIRELIEDNVVVVTGHKNRTVSASSKAKIKSYLKTNGKDKHKVYLFDTLPGAPWTDEIDTVDWSEISSIRLSTGTAGGSTGPIPILIWRTNGWRDETLSLDLTQPVILVSPRDEHYAYNQFRRILNVFPKAQIIQLGANRWDKFKRENPGAIDMNTYWNHQFPKAVAATLTKDEIACAAMGYHERRFAEVFQGQKFADPALNELIRVYKFDSKRVQEYNVLVGSKPTDVLDKYPLMGDHKSTIEHSIIYADAVYAKKGK